MNKKKAWLAGSALGALAVTVALGVAVTKRVRRNLAAIPPSEIVSTGRAKAALVAAETAYDSKLGKGWEDWGWGPHQLSQNGPATIVFAGYGGIVLHHNGELPFHFGGLTFRYRAPSDWPEFLAVSLKRAGSDDAVFPLVRVEPRHVAKLDDGWREVLIDASELNPSSLPIDRVSIVARSMVERDGVLLDKVFFTTPDGKGPPAGPTRESSLRIMCRGVTRPISPWIYGAANGDWDSGMTSMRIGGNPITRLNWDLANTWNSGSDWFFENATQTTGLWDWLDAGVAHKANVALTVPMIGWVAKDGTSVGFPASKFPGQRKRDPNRPEAGDGYRPDGNLVPPGPPTETSVAAPPDVIARWIRGLREKDAARGARSVGMYILDNEPSLWNITHRDVHPDPETYDELLDRTIKYATEIRKADPDAMIAGPAEAGWMAYFYSAKDREAGKLLMPDRLMHGGTPLIPWYLSKLAEYEKANGMRLLDVLDVHFYPSADGVWGQQARTDAGGVALRLRQTRSLWDPEYVDESWIKESIHLIPRLQQWVNDNYPGRKISIGEWSFGADQHFSGALATVEALGRFGQYGLDSAFYWDGPKTNTGTFWAFRAFRNFDGKGARFQDVSLTTREEDKVSLFASRDEARTHVVAIAVNRDPLFTVDLHLALDDCAAPESHRVFFYGPGSSELTERTVSAEDKAKLDVELAPYTFAVIDIQLRAEAGR